jgi:hypothetical protein
MKARPIRSACGYAAIAEGRVNPYQTIWGRLHSLVNVGRCSGRKVYGSDELWVGDAIRDSHGMALAMRNGEFQLALGAVLDWIEGKFDWVLQKIQPVIDAPVG